MQKIKTRPSRRFNKLAARVQKICGVEPQIIDWVPGFSILIFRREDLGIQLVIELRAGQKKPSLYFGTNDACFESSAWSVISKIVTQARPILGRSKNIYSSGVPVRTADGVWRKLCKFGYEIGVDTPR